MAARRGAAGLLLPGARGRRLEGDGHVQVVEAVRHEAQPLPLPLRARGEGRHEPDAKGSVASAGSPALLAHAVAEGARERREKATPTLSCTSCATSTLAASAGLGLCTSRIPRCTSDTEYDDERAAPHAIGRELGERAEHLEGDGLAVGIRIRPEAQPRAPVGLALQVLLDVEPGARRLRHLPHLGREDGAQVALARLSERHEVSAVQVAADGGHRNAAATVGRRKPRETVVGLQQSVATCALPLAPREAVGHGHGDRRSVAHDEDACHRTTRYGGAPTAGARHPIATSSERSAAAGAVATTTAAGTAAER